MARDKHAPAVVEKHPDGWLVVYATPGSTKRRQRIFQYEKAARKFAMRQEVQLKDAADGLEVGIAFDGGAGALDGSALSHWRDVLWRGYIALASTPHNDDLERRVKACSSAFRSALPTLLREESAFDTPEALAESAKVRTQIAEMLAASTLTPQ